jgi:hypothetical protein
MSSNLWLKTAGGLVEVGGAVQGRPIQVWQTWLTEHIIVGTTVPDIGVGTEIQIPAVGYDRTLVITTTAAFTWDSGGTVAGRWVRAYARLNNDTVGVVTYPWASSAAVGQASSFQETHQATTTHFLAADTPLQIDMAASKNGASENTVAAGAGYSGLVVTAYPAAVAPSGIEEPDPGPWTELVIRLPENWDATTRPPMWRTKGDEVEFRGFMLRTGTNFGAASFAEMSSNPTMPIPVQSVVVVVFARILAQTPSFPEGVGYGMVATTTNIQASSTTFTIATGDRIYFDGLSYSVTP